MRVMAVTVALVMAHAIMMTPSHAQSFPDVVREIRAADYRGARADLEGLAGVLEGMKEPKLAALWHYWRGFAVWRRAINGFNETPTPPDLESDLKAGVASFQPALASQPDWIEAQIGILGCAGPLAYLAKDDALRREVGAKEYTAIVGSAMRAVSEKGADISRALWLMGQNQTGRRRAGRPSARQGGRDVSPRHRGCARRGAPDRS